MNNITTTLDAFSQGEIIIIIDDYDRENEGDFVQAAEYVTPQSVNFMITHGRGLVCQAINEDIAHRLHLTMPTKENTSLHSTAFTVSVDYSKNTTTGISVHDRAKTIRAIADPTTDPTLLARPGHIFPIIAHPLGLTARRGHTEAAVALASLLCKHPSAIVCEILNREGNAARLAELEDIAQKYTMPLVHMQDLVQYIAESTKDVKTS